MVLLTLLDFICLLPVQERYSPNQKTAQMSQIVLNIQVAACLVRVPTEIVKQRRQAGAASHGLAVIRSTISSEVPTHLPHFCFLV